jgi:hypothetical protein
LPFQRDRFRAGIAPELGRASPGKNQNLLLVHMAHRSETFSRGDLRDQHTDETLRAFEVTISRRPTEPLPMFEGRGFQIIDAVSAENRQSVFIAPIEKSRFSLIALS